MYNYYEGKYLSNSEKNKTKWGVNMKKVLIVLLTTLVMTISISVGAEVPSAPSVSLESGFYADGTILEINGSGNIFYTLNGDVPTKDSMVYTKPITLQENLISPRSVQGYVAQEQTYKAVVVRAAAIGDDGTSSTVVSRVYFVGNGVLEFYGLPIVNLTIDTYDLWSGGEGIYENYYYEHNVPAVFQYFDEKGALGAEREVEVKVSGHGSRNAAKKSMRVYFNKGDISNGKYIDCNIIPNTRKNYKDSEPVTQFYKLTMRISDWTGTNLRDVLAQKIGGYTRADVANSTPAALFLNGEFWGVYECREQYDERYIGVHYGVDDDDIVYLNRDWTLDAQHIALNETGTVYTEKMEYSSGPKDDNKHGYLGESYYTNQWLYIRSLAEEKDITTPEVYEEFCSLVDIDNYIDYILTYIYAANDDWPGNNFKLWRVTQEKIDPNVYGLDGKWRFMIHDFDIAFEDVNHDTLYLCALQKGEETDARHPEFATKMLGSLLKNNEFRSEFSQRLMAYLSTAMSEENINALVDKLEAERKVGKVRDLLRWNLGSGSTENRMNRWLRYMDSFRNYAKERPAVLKNQVVRILNGEPYNAAISGEATMNFRCVNSYVSISGAEITKERYGEKAESFSTTQFAGVPIHLEAYDQYGNMAKLTVLHNGITESFVGTAEFVPQNGEYTINIEAVQ